MNKLVMLPLLWLYATLAFATEMPEVVKLCMEKNTPATSSVQSIELRARDRSGYEQVLAGRHLLEALPGQSLKNTDAFSRARGYSRGALPDYRKYTAE